MKISSAHCTVKISTSWQKLREINSFDSIHRYKQSFSKILISRNIFLLSEFLFFSQRPSLEIPSDGIILGCLVVFAVIPMLSLLCVCFVWILMDNLFYRNHPIFRENNPEVELIELVYVLPPDIFVHGWLQSQFKKIWGLSEKMKMEHQMLYLGNFHFFGEIEFNCGQ